jgi:hypothetical protein
MNNRGNIFGGAILVAFGVFFLGYINDWFQFDISLRDIAKFWPLFIILAGVAVLFNHKKTIFNPTTALLIAFAIPLAIYNASTRTIDNVKENLDEELNFEWDDDSSNDYEDYDSDENDTTAIKGRSNQQFSVLMQPGVEYGQLEVGGGAAEFHLEEPQSGNIFEANSRLYGSKFKLEDEKKGNIHEIKFKMNSKNNSNNIKVGKGFDNDVYLKLNKTPVWDLDLGIGAGQLKFDLSDYKVRDIKMETGAADINLKMGEKLAESKIRVESGVAKIKILVPKNSGCQINMDGALNAKDFNGFSKDKPGHWKTDNFASAKNKIYIEIESGLSAVTVDRY